MPCRQRWRPLASESKSRQTLRAVVGDGDTGNLLQRAVRFGGIPHQLRRIPVDLVEVFTIWRNPAVARSAADVSTKPPEGAIALDVGACRILRDSDLETVVDTEAGDVAVPENRTVQESVIGGHGQPAKFSGRASLCVDRYDPVDANSAIFVDSGQGHSIADGISDDERIRPAFQESDVERRSASSILERAFAERAVGIDAVDYYAVGIRSIRSDELWCAVRTRHPKNWGTVRIGAGDRNGQIERGADKQKFLIW